MAHWRDGGIGNVAGSDDRPIGEWTLLEKLAELAACRAGEPLPRCLGGPGTEWGTPMAAIAQLAFDEIVRLRANPASVSADGLVLTIFGIRYDIELFRALAFAETGAVFRIVERGDGVVALEGFKGLILAQTAENGGAT